MGNPLGWSASFSSALNLGPWRKVEVYLLHCSYAMFLEKPVSLRDNKAEWGLDRSWKDLKLQGNELTLYFDPVGML